MIRLNSELKQFLTRHLGGKKKPGYGQQQVQQPPPQQQPPAQGKGQKQQQQQAGKGPKKTGVFARYHGEVFVIPMVTVLGC